MAAAVDDAWRMLPKVFIAMMAILIDGDRLEHGKVKYLKITAAERKALIHKITSSFPKAKPGGGHAIEVAAQLLRQWLQTEWRASDDPA